MYFAQPAFECKVALVLLTAVDLLNDLVRGEFVDGAADALRSSENLLYGTAQLVCQALEPHCSRNVNDGVKVDVSRVLDVLLLLPVARGLLERSDDEGRCRGNDRDGSLTVLNRQLNSDSKSLPFGSVLGNVLSNDLGRL